MYVFHKQFVLFNFKYLPFLSENPLLLYFTGIKTCIVLKITIKSVYGKKQLAWIYLTYMKEAYFDYFEQSLHIINFSLVIH